MEELVLRCQRFPQGHKLYTDKEITNTDPKKFVGTFKSVFSQCVDADGNILNYGLERFDTLIAEGIYEFSYYDSPANKMKVVLLTKFNGEDISARKIEWHIANKCIEVEACRAIGTAINLEVPMVVGSTPAFNKFMTWLNGRTGKIIYETLPLDNA